MRLGRGAAVASASLAAAALALASCADRGEDDGGDTTVERKRVKAAVKGLQDAFAANDLGRVCDLMTEDGRRYLDTAGHDRSKPCREGVEEFAGFLSQRRKGSRRMATPKVLRIRVDGDQATATITDGGGLISAVPLAKEDGEWKVDALYGDKPGGQQKDKI